MTRAVFLIFILMFFSIHEIVYKTSCTVSVVGSVTLVTQLIL